MGLWAFTTDMVSAPQISTELVPVAPMADNLSALEGQIESLVPLNGTPLYAVVRAATEYMDATADPTLINAVVVLTDGKNEYPPDSDLDSLVDELRSASSENGVRVFTIGYSEGSDLGTLQEISEASRAKAYDASDPASISSVFSAVLSNF